MSYSRAWNFATDRACSAFQLITSTYSSLSVEISETERSIIKKYSLSIQKKPEKIPSCRGAALGTFLVLGVSKVLEIVFYAQHNQYIHYADRPRLW